MSRSKNSCKGRRNWKTSFNKALKSDNKLIRFHVRIYLRRVFDNLEYWYEVPVPIRRESSNPWDYD